MSFFVPWSNAVSPDRTGLQLLARVVLPRSRDPQTGGPMTVLLRGDVYDRSGLWQQLTIREADQLLERQVRVLRSQFGPDVDAREAYADLLVVNAYGGTGVTNLWIDDLELRGQIAGVREAMRGEITVYCSVAASYTVLAERLGTFAAQFMDWVPQRLQITYRGSIARHDCTLLRLAFLKGFLKNSLEYVSYVNAEDRALSIGLKVDAESDPGFTDYESEVRYGFKGQDREFNIGGVVFSGPHPRISLVDGFEFEIEPEGTFLAIRSKDRLGVVTGISSLLDKHKIQIDSFEFSHSKERKRSMFLIRVRKNVGDEVVEEIRSQEHITLVRKIQV